jgi:GR25 family glycosyltransferase involved in LPS biosynthesis
MARPKKLYWFFLCLLCFESCSRDKKFLEDLSLPKEELIKIPSGFEMSLNSFYYINLDRSADRRIQFENNYKSYGFELIRYPGVLGSMFKYDPRGKGVQILDENKNYTYEYDPHFSVKGLSPGEIGNYLSHYQLLEIAAESEDPVLIMEDDAVPIDDFKLRLTSAMAHIPEDWDILYLYCNALEEGGCNRNRASLLEDRRFVRMDRSCTAGNVAYVLNAKGAQKLLKNTFPIRRPTDLRIQDFCATDHSFKSYCVYPELVRTIVNGSDSVINSMGR